MTKSESDIYRKLQAHLDSMPIGYPSTKSGVELRILKYIFSPEQAEIACFLDWKWKNLEEIHKLYGKEKISLKDLEVTLDHIVKNGGLSFKEKDGFKYWANAPIVVGMYEYQLSNLTPDLVKDFFHYIREAFGFEILSTKVNQLRTIPVDLSIESHKNIANYEDIKKIIQNAKGPIGLADCICKKGADLIHRPCKITDRREICMAVDWMAQLYINQGWGREITREEALEVLRKNEEDGLILQVENTENPTFFCGCCTCCCGMAAGLKRMYKPHEYIGTNFYAEVNAEECTGCGVCVNRCQMEAITLDDDCSKVNMNRCIGCGVCVISCPIEAISLKRRPLEAVPPKDFEDLYSKILESKLEKKEKLLKRKLRSKN